MGGSERASSSPRLMSRGRGQTERNCAARGKKRPLLSPNAFRAYLADGRQPFVPAASATTVCFEPIPSVPLFRGGSGRSSALIDAPRSSDGENITRTKAACQDNSSNGGRLVRISACDRGCVKTSERFHTDLFCSLFRALRSVGSEKIANIFAPRDCLHNFAEFSHSLGP
jgi:hypothetical protein